MSKIILFNKPFKVLCQFTDEKQPDDSSPRSTLADYIDERRVYPAGRLDYDSEGLVLLTDDGKLQHQISHPKAKMAKTYWVQVEGQPSEEQLLPLRRGIQLSDGPCKPAIVKKMAEALFWERNPPIRERKNHPTQWLEITISEGRNRQVRRMTAAIGFPTLRLIRTRIGEWQLDDLKPGEMRKLEIHPSKAQFQRRKYTKKTTPRL